MVCKANDLKPHFWSLFFNFRFLAENLKATKNEQNESLILQYNFAQKASFILQASTQSTL